MPVDARTLLKTPKKPNIVSVGSGQYSHFGLEKSIKSQLISLKINDARNEFEVDISVDGMPISKSSNIGFWPILGCIRNCEPQMAPFLIGIFYGEGKPSSCKEFLTMFVNEYRYKYV